jgi:hypothetical protein
MPNTPDDLETLVHLLHSCIGRKIKIDESITRSRDIGGHDRHFATHSHFRLTLQEVMVTTSGAQLLLLGKNGRYGISLDSVAGFQENQAYLEIIEHFELETERRTRLTTSSGPSSS